MCVTTGPPIRGDPISHSQAHIPLKPLPPATRRKIFFRGTGLPTAVRKNQPPVPRSNFGGKVCARTDPWFRGQTLPVPGHGGGGVPILLQPHKMGVWGQNAMFVG